MQVNILWSGREYYSLENCIVSGSESGWQINSVIIGMFNDAIYKVEYIIRTTRKWETISMELRSWSANKFRELKLETTALAYGRVAKKSSMLSMGASTLTFR